MCIRDSNEAVLEEVTVKALNQILSSRKAFLKHLQENIARAVVTTDTLSPDGIQARLEELQKDLVKAVGDQKNYDALTDEILRLQQMKKDSEVDDHRRTETMNRIKELQDFIAEQMCIRDRNECRARAEANLKLAQHDFKLPPLLTDTEIEVILGKVDELVSWAYDIKEYALQQALSGKEWSGFKLVEGRANRKYSNETAVILSLIHIYLFSKEECR